MGRVTGVDVRFLAPAKCAALGTISTAYASSILQDCRHSGKGGRFEMELVPPTLHDKFWFGRFGKTLKTLDGLGNKADVQELKDEQNRIEKVVVTIHPTLTPAQKREKKDQDIGQGRFDL